jgi:hypothetical protein
MSTMNSIAAFQMVRALDEERLRRAEQKRQARERHASPTPPDATTASGSWRSVLRFPRFATATSKS